MVEAGTGTRVAVGMAWGTSTVGGEHVGRAVGDAGSSGGQLTRLAGQAEIGLVGAGGTARCTRRAGESIGADKGTIWAVVDTLAVG